MKHLLSLDSLMQIIRHNKVSIRSYIKDGILPEPIIDGESLFFDKNELEEKLNKSLDEPFLLIEEASSLTGLSKSHITIMCGKDSFPHFRLKTKKGAKLLFIRSEIEDFIQFDLEWNIGFSEKQIFLNLFEKLFTVLFFNEEDKKNFRVLPKLFFTNKTRKELAEEMDFSDERFKQLFQREIKIIKSRVEWLPDAETILERERSSREKVSKLEQKILELEQKILVKDILIKDLEGKVRIKDGLKIKQGLGDLLLEDSKFEISSILYNRFRDMSCEKGEFGKIFGIKDISELTLYHIIIFPAKRYKHVRNFGKKSLAELEKFVKSKGLSLNWDNS